VTITLGVEIDEVSCLFDSLDDPRRFSTAPVGVTLAGVMVSADAAVLLGRSSVEGVSCEAAHAL
jgi:hypothetical protein